jgi:hypothetical protein
MDLNKDKLTFSSVTFNKILMNKNLINFCGIHLFIDAKTKLIVL